jgi:hypothetical protein
MPYVDPEFTVPTIPEDEKYEGTELDDNVRKSIDRLMKYCGAFSLTAD